jgi:hypothetical protein
VNTFTITASAGANGTITPTGATSVSSGASQTFTIAPSTGYFIANVLVDGTSAGAVSTYTFTNVTANHTISATFAVNTFTITASAGANGTITPTGATSVSSGASKTFTITPGTGSSIANVLVDGTSVGAVSTYTFTNVTANHTISASFAVNTYTITATAGANGTITPSGSVTVNYGSNGSFTITPNINYSIASVIVDGTSVGAVSTYTFTNVAANHTLSASFTANAITPPITRNLSCTDSGIPCVVRTDGGSDGDNLVNGKPKGDLIYAFTITVMDTGGMPQQVRLHMAQRSNPTLADFATYTTSCSGDFTAGATCTYQTNLGPAAVHTFYFDATMSDGTTIIRYPQTGFMSGPKVQLLTGYNLMGVSRSINAAGLSGQAATSSPNTFRLNPVTGAYSLVSSTSPAKAGEGYFSYKGTTTLPELAAYADVQQTTYTIPVQKGWNIISNPYIANVRLADVMVQRGTAAPVSWQAAVANGWVVNSLYSYTGSDWGGTYVGTSDATAVLVPWRSYMMYFKNNDTTYALIITKP